MVYNFPHDLVLVVLGVVFRTGNSSGKPLLLPVLKKPPPGRAENYPPPVSEGGALIECRDYLFLLKYCLTRFTVFVCYVGPRAV